MGTHQLIRSTLNRILGLIAKVDIHQNFLTVVERWILLNIGPGGWNNVLRYITIHKQIYFLRPKDPSFQNVSEPGTTFPTKLPVRPAKTQIRLRFAQTDQSLLPTWSSFGLCYPQNSLRIVWSDSADAGANPSLRWAHILSCMHAVFRLVCQSAKAIQWLDTKRKIINK